MGTGAFFADVDFAEALVDEAFLAGVFLADDFRAPDLDDEAERLLAARDVLPPRTIMVCPG